MIEWIEKAGLRSCDDIAQVAWRIRLEEPKSFYLVEILCIQCVSVP